MKRKITKALAGLLAAVTLMSTIDMTTLASENISAYQNPEPIINLIPDQNSEIESNHDFSNGIFIPSDEKDSIENQDASDENNSSNVQDSSDQNDSFTNPDVPTEINDETVSENTTLDNPENPVKEGDVLASGNCGENATYYLSSDYILTISGTGALSSAPAVSTYKTQIKGLVVEEGITTLAENLCYGFSNLETISLPSTLTTINKQAFRDCKLLTEVTLPAALESLGISAFESCTSLSSIIFDPNSKLTVLDNYAFYKCTSMEEITLPESVTGINYQCFYGCSKLKSITLPENVTTIGKSVFENCLVLETVTFEDESKLTSLGGDAFKKCTALKQFTIPSGITTLDSGLFDNCDSLTSIEIPKSITKINNNIFANCDNLETITFENGFAPTSFGSGFATGCKKLNNVVLPESITVIPDSTFNGCTELSNITMKGAVTTIGQNAFSQCPALVSITLPDSLETIKDNAFKQSTGLKEITIPAKVTSIPMGAFYGCTDLSKITFKDSSKITSIGKEAFRDCKSLSSFTVPANVTTLDVSLFESCIALSSVTFESTNTITTIKDYAFYKCSSLESITLPTTISTIPLQCFLGCSKLKSLTIPEGVTTINNNAFENCTSLEEVFLPDSLLKIGTNTFRQCSALKDIAIPSAITSLENNTFYGCSKLESITIPANITTLKEGVFQNCTALESVTYTDGSKITSLGKNTFDGCTSLKIAPIPSGITTLDSKTFANCDSLTQVVIPKNITKVNDEAFRDCDLLSEVSFEEGSQVTTIPYAFLYGTPMLKSFVLPSSVTTISNYILQNSGLKEITIPKSVTSIDQNAFKNAGNLEAINVETGNTVYYSEEGVLYKYSDNTMQKKDDDPVFFRPAASTALPKNLTVLTTDYFRNNKSIKNIVIPARITSIESYAFEGCTSLETVSFENGSKIETIKSRAFSGCTSLKNISISKSITTLDSAAFYNCSALEEINIEAGNNSYMSDEGIVYSLPDYDIYITPASRTGSYKLHSGTKKLTREYYEGNKTITTLTLPSSIEIIDTYAFNGCEALGSITLSSKLSTINSYAFRDCTSLEEISIPKSVTSISSNAFYGCSKLKNINVENGNTKYYSINGIVYTQDGKVFIKPPANTEEEQAPELKEGVKILGTQFYKGNKEVTTVTIPASVEEISPEAFKGCEKLTTIKFASGSKLKKIGDYAFRDCDSLKTISLPSGVTEIGTGCFYECINLTSLTIPAKVTTIKAYTFYNCRNLKTVTAKGAKSVGNYAFFQCGVLTSASLSADVTQIGDYAFQYCRSLTKVPFGSKIYSIGSYAFDDCSAIKTLPLGSSLYIIGNSAFSGMEGITTAVIPESVSPTYFGTYVFSYCTKLKTIKINAKLTSIPSGTFADCSSLTSVTFANPDLILSINTSAFSGCTALTTYTIPLNVTSLGHYAFKNCTSLKEIKFNEKCTSFGTYGTFLNCSSLTALTIPDGVTTIGAETFMGCSSLKEISLPDSVTNIGSSAFKNCVSVTQIDLNKITYMADSAFEGCTSLKEVTIPGSLGSSFSSGGYQFESCTALETITFEEGIVSIPNSFLSKDTALKIINFPSTFKLSTTVYSSYETLFNTCSSLEEINVAEDNTTLFSQNGILYERNGEYATLLFCPMAWKQTRLVIPDSVTSIKGATFKGNKNLTYVSIPASLTKIDSSAFYNCDKLQRVVFRKDSKTGKGTAFTSINSFLSGNENLIEVLFEGETNVSTFENYAFSGCSILQKVVFENNSSDIALGSYVFQNDTQFRGVYNAGTPIAFSAIGADAFKNNNHLTEILLSKNCSSFTSSYLSSCGTLARINVEDGNEQFYSVDGVLFIKEWRYSGVTYENVLYYYPAKHGARYVVPDGTCGIYSEAFRNNSTLYSVKFPASLELIDTSAFRGATNLTNVEFADNNKLSVLGNYAFCECSSLNLVDFGKNSQLKSIGHYAFYQCSNLDTMELPDTVKFLGKSAFYNCFDWKNPSIPAALEGELLEGTYYDCSALTEIVIPDGVTAIGTSKDEDGVFESTNLNSVTFSNTGNLSYIGQYAFRGTELKELILPEGLKTLSTLAFAFTDIETISFPKSLTTIETANFKSYGIGSLLFYSSDSLTDIVINNDELEIPRYLFLFSSSNINIHAKKGSLAETYVHNYNETESATTGTTLTFLELGAEPDPTYPDFKEDNNFGSKDEFLYSLKAPGILTIEPNPDFEGESKGILSARTNLFSHVFWNPSVVKTLVIGEGITEIEEGYLDAYINIENMYLPSTLKAYNSLCTYNYHLTYVELADGIELIDDDAFYNCMNLQTVVIPSSVKKIGSYAFYYTPILNNITIPSSVTEIDSYAFLHSGITSLEFDSDSKLTTIGESAFESCYSLKKAILPESLLSVGAYAFQTCTNLTELYIPSKAKGFALKDNTLEECSSLSKLVVSPENPDLFMRDGILYHTDSILDNTYNMVFCTYHNEGADGVITIPYNVNNILSYGNYNFIHEFKVEEGSKYFSSYDGILYSANGDSLVLVPRQKTGSVTVKFKTQVIGENAFANCEEIEEILLPNTLQQIEENAFTYCSSLKYIEIPDSVTSLGSMSFAFCSSLEKVKLSNHLQAINYSSFLDDPSLSEIYIPDGITSIKMAAFENCCNLNTVRLPETLVSISMYAFDSCTSMTDIVLPESLTTISSYAFSKCSNLKNVYTSGNITDIAPKAFQNCSSSLTFYGEKDSNVEIYAKTFNFRFVAIDNSKFHIFYLLDSTLGEENAEENPYSYYVKDPNIKLYPATKPGYTFGGWYTDLELTKSISTIYTASAKNYTLYAKWLENHTVTLLNEDLSLYKTVQVADGMLLDSTDYPTAPDGHRFAGWQQQLMINETSIVTGFSFDTPVTSDLTLIASYTTADFVAPDLPKANLISGIYASNNVLSLTSDTPNASIYYWVATTENYAMIDGNFVKNNGVLYTQPVALKDLTDGTSLKIYAIATNNYCCSNAAYFEYELYEESEWGEIDINDRAAFRSPSEVPKGIWVTNIEDSYEYLGIAITPDPKVYYGTRKLTKKVDYKLSYKNNINVAKADATKAPSVIITGIGGYKGSITKTFTITPALLYSQNAEELTISKFESILCYNGKVQKQKPVIYFYSKKMVLNKDYVLTYTDVNYIGEKNGYQKCIITVKGINNFEGQFNLTYYIVDGIPLSKVKVSNFKSSVPYSEDRSFSYNYQDSLVLTYTNSAKETVTLQKYIDYSVEYENYFEPGTATMIITGLGNYSGTIRKTFKITSENLKKAKVNGIITKVNYTGYSILQNNLTLTVKNGNNVETLTEGEDYEVSYLNNVKAGTATILFTGIGKYRGVIKKSFKITPYDIKADSTKSKPYIDVEMPDDVSYDIGGAKAKPVVLFKGKVLTENKDYKLSYKNNSKIGTIEELGAKAPTVIITGTGCFSGKLEYRYNIVKAKLREQKAVAKDVVFKNVAGNHKTLLTVTNAFGKKLSLNKDYIVEDYEYAFKTTLTDGTIKNPGDKVNESDCVSAGTIIRANLKATGTNYEGTSFLLYRVYTADISKAIVTLSSKNYTGKEITLLESDLTIQLTKNDDPLESKDFEIISYQNNIKTGTAKVTIKGVGNYGGEKTVSFKIDKTNIN